MRSCASVWELLAISASRISISSRAAIRSLVTFCKLSLGEICICNYRSPAVTLKSDKNKGEKNMHNRAVGPLMQNCHTQPGEDWPVGRLALLCGILLYWEMVFVSWQQSVDGLGRYACGPLVAGLGPGETWLVSPGSGSNQGPNHFIRVALEQKHTPSLSSGLPWPPLCLCTDFNPASMLASILPLCRPLTTSHNLTLGSSPLLSSKWPPPHGYCQGTVFT